LQASRVQRDIRATELAEWNHSCLDWRGPSGTVAAGGLITDKNAMDSIPVIPGDTLLYKFRALDNAEFAADILLNHRLFAAPPSSFNDPFDCNESDSFSATEEEKIDRAVARIRKEDPSVGDEKARRLAPDRCKSAETNGSARNRTWKESELGVVSLAGTVTNPLLWAHYASGNSGICIEFCASQLRHLEFFGNALPVVYQSERNEVNFYRDDPMERVRKHLLTKSRHWEYEQEWRIIVQNRQQQKYVYFDPTLVRAVYLGCRITAEKREIVRGWLSKRAASPAPRLFQADVSDTEYELVFEELPIGELNESKSDSAVICN
jgi:hypothetical protein